MHFIVGPTPREIGKRISLTIFIYLLTWYVFKFTTIILLVTVLTILSCYVLWFYVSVQLCFCLIYMQRICWYCCALVIMHHVMLAFTVVSVSSTFKYAPFSDGLQVLVINKYNFGGELEYMYTRTILIVKIIETFNCNLQSTDCWSVSTATLDMLKLVLPHSKLALISS